MQRELCGCSGTQPFGRRQPDWMGGTIGIAKAADVLRHQFDPARRRAQWMRNRVGAERFEHHIIARRRRQFHPAARDEFLVGRQGHSTTPRAGTHPAPQFAQPCIGVAAFSECRFVAGTRGQFAKNVEIVATFANWRNRPLHRENEAVARGTAYVAAFQRRSRRQHNVGAARSRRPPAFVHHHGGRLVPDSREPIQVLMMVKRVAAGPVDEVDVGINVLPPVEVKRGAGVFQHVGQARHRNRAAGRVGTGCEFR